MDVHCVCVRARSLVRLLAAFHTYNQHVSDETSAI